MTDSEYIIGASVASGQGKSSTARAMLTQALAVAARPPDNPPDGPEWKKIPGAGDFPAVKDFYEFSHRGKVRSLDHTTKGTFYEGSDPLKPRRDGDGYFVVNITMADGTRSNGVSVARLILLAHDPEGYEPGLQACHGPGGQLDNRWPENLRWGTDEENRADWRRDNPARPKPLKVCPRCEREHSDPGRRCHPCVMELGRQAAYYLSEGTDDLEALAKALDYPNVAGLFRLAKRYGRLRCTVEPIVLIEECNAAVMAARAAAHSPSWLRRVINRRKASRQDSDAP